MVSKTTGRMGFESTTAGKEAVVAKHYNGLEALIRVA